MCAKILRQSGVIKTVSKGKIYTWLCLKRGVGFGTEILSRRITYGNFGGNGQVVLEPEITQRRSKRGNRQGGQVNREAWMRLKHQSQIQYLIRSHCTFLITKVASKIFRCCISIMLNDLLSLIKIWSNSCFHA